jgi:hypothetical protein
MALKALVKDINEVPEAFRGEYESTGSGVAGEMRLKLEGDIPGFAPKAKLDEFRTSNDTLKNEKVALETKLAALKDIDPEEYKRLKEKRPNETQAEFETRLNATLKPVKDELDSEKAKNVALSTEISKLKINDAAVAAGVEYGIRPAAQIDLINRVSQYAKIEDGKVTIYDDKGEKRYSTNSANAGNLLTIKEFVAEMAEKSSHLFEPSTGTAAKGGAGGGAPNGAEGPNPWLKASRNLTRQAEMIKKNPARAKQLAAQAGITLTNLQT